MHKRSLFVLGGIAVLLFLSAAPGALALPMEDPIDLPVEEPIDPGAGGESGGGGPTLPGGPFNPPPQPFLFAPNLALATAVGSVGFQRCEQLAHVWVAFSNDVTRGTTLYGTGVVVPGSHVVFGFYNPAGQLVKTHVTQTARDNCVVHHEPETISTWDLTPGYYFIYASYWSLSVSGFVDNYDGYPTGRVGKYVSVIRIR